MNVNSPAFCICIPTYKRCESLIALLLELTKQSISPQVLAIIDGDPLSGDVLRALIAKQIDRSFKNVIYIPSNHANLPYERYLGWKLAEQASSRYLVYLDDDLLPSGPETLSKLVEPLAFSNGDVIAVTSKIVYPFSRKESKDRWFIHLLGDARRSRPGTITPSGNRIPVTSDGRDYIHVDYLGGGAMAFLTNALSDEVFSRDLFAVYEKRIGKGEDTILSLRLKGVFTFLFAFNSVFLHPENDPVAYPTSGFNRGYAIAISRRMINDNYRGKHSPLMRDKLALYKTYIGVSILNLARMKDMYHFQFAVGYIRGVLSALIHKPSASNLTPGIDWWSDAEAALRQKICI